MTSWYVYVGIKPAPGGFGEWQAQQPEDDMPLEPFENAIYSEEQGDVYELGVDDLPEGVEDIRGNIHDEPDAVYAVVEENSNVAYFGINVCKLRDGEEGPICYGEYCKQC
jgi:hypothetical protein